MQRRAPGPSIPTGASGSGASNHHAGVSMLQNTSLTPPRFDTNRTVVGANTQSGPGSVGASHSGRAHSAYPKAVSHMELDRSRVDTPGQIPGSLDANLNNGLHSYWDSILAPAESWNTTPPTRSQLGMAPTILAPPTSLYFSPTSTMAGDGTQFHQAALSNNLPLHRSPALSSASALEGRSSHRAQTKVSQAFRCRSGRRQGPVPSKRVT